MMTFQEFLKKRGEEERMPERRKRRDEWVAAVGQLLDQIRVWLRESDPEQVLDVAPMVVQRGEPNLGYYDVPSLKISIGNRAVEVSPMGRDALGSISRRGLSKLGAEGRVDITDGVRKFILYRTFEDGQERWYALDEHFQAAPLDRSRLEAMLQDLLE